MIIILKHLELYGNITGKSRMITDSESFKSRIKIIGKNPTDYNKKVIKIIGHQ